MAVNLYETAIDPVVDSDTDVVVYVPGYAKMGPDTPKLVDSSTFTAYFGDSPYLFENNQTEGLDKNKTYKGRPEKSWLYAKGLVDNGLTVLYHRVNPNCVPKAVGIDSEGNPAAIALKIAGLTGTVDVTNDKDYAGTSDSGLTSIVECKLYVRAKYFGRYYNGIYVTAAPAGYSSNNKTSFKGATLITVKDSSNNTLESKTVYFDSSKTNYIGNVTFTYIDLYLKLADGTDYDSDFDVLALDSWYASEDAYDSTTEKNLSIYGYAEKITLKVPDADDDTGWTGGEEFSVSAFEEWLEDSSNWEAIKDVEMYDSTSYITSGGYYQTKAITGVMQAVAYEIKAIALIDWPDEISTVDALDGVQADLTTTGADSAAMAKSAMFIGADTFTLSGYNVVMPDSYGYLAKLGSNRSGGIAYWIPVANTSNGIVAATATTRSLSRSVRESMITDDGVSINPIYYKNNSGYVIMGNRTLYPTDGSCGPESYLNVQLIVNGVLRSARRAAQKLLIVSTSPTTAFNTFKTAVSATCDKMMVNDDGLASYSITKKSKTQAATMDVAIYLVVREGIETINVYCEYSLDMGS